MTVYLLAYDPLHPSVNADAIHRFIVDSRNIDGWAHYFPGCYMINSELQANQLASVLADVFGSRTPSGPRFLLTEMHKINTDGSMPNAGWDWFFRHQNVYETPGVSAYLEKQLGS